MNSLDTALQQREKMTAVRIYRCRRNSVVVKVHERMARLFRLRVLSDESCRPQKIQSSDTSSPTPAVEQGSSDWRKTCGAKQVKAEPGVGRRNLNRKRNRLIAEILADLIAKSMTSR
jgi:hypothetical protein